jgi:nucleoid DNA-binding protein
MVSLGLTQAQSKKALNGLLAAVSIGLAAGETIKLSGFGSFHVKQLAARIRRNPHTGEQIETSPKKVVKFRASKALGTGGKSLARRKPWRKIWNT